MSKSIFYSSMKSILRPHIKPIYHEFNSDDNVVLKKSNRIIIEIASECVIERPYSFSFFQLNINNLVHFISNLWTIARNNHQEFFADIIQLLPELICNAK
jgi:hypothetical protein